MNVYDQAHSLATAVKESEEYKQFQARKKDIEGNPELEIYGYATILRSMTGGAGDFSYTFARYEQAPGDVQEREIEARASKVDKGEE